MSIFNSNFKIDEILRFLKNKDKKIHFVGICGVSMCALAIAFCKEGYIVSGSDTSADEEIKRELLNNGITLFEKDEKDNVKNAGIICYSLAIPENSQELCEGKKLGIPLISRAQLLGAYMLNYKFRIGVCGSHGKSTTVSMIKAVFEETGLSPTVFSGSKLDCGKTFVLASKDVFIYEACEYKDSFLHFYPNWLVVTSIELDHTDYFKNIDDYRDSFRKAVDNSDKVFLNIKGEQVKKLKNEISTPSVIIYDRKGEDRSYREVFDKGRQGEDYSYADVADTDCGIRFDFYKNKKRIFDVDLNMIGYHNAENASLALSVGLEYGIDEEKAVSAIRKFKGLSRRAEFLGTVFKRPLFYDYAHHPTEIVSTLTSLKRRYGKVTAIFRPHTYTRTRDLFFEFVKALRIADFPLILDIYPAREEPIDGVNSQRLANAIGGECRYIKDIDVVNYVKSHTSGVVVLMGAGNLDKTLKEFKEIKDNIK